MTIRIATTEGPDRFHHYARVVESTEFEWLGTLRPPFDEGSLGQLDALIVSCDHHLPSRRAIAACKAMGIPTFHILDGVVDWRSTFKNPKYSMNLGGVALHQPLIADHVFVMGAIQQTQMRWLGNRNIHATGLARFDEIDRNPCRRGGLDDDEPSILVATANTAWANEEQRSVLEMEMLVLTKELESQRNAGVWKSVVYRISDDLAKAVGVEAERTGSALQALGQSDVVITTPSTLAVEAMMLGVPTCILDPFGFPMLTPSAWPATGSFSVLQHLASLRAPEDPQASYQDHLVECLTHSDRCAAERVRRMILASAGVEDSEAEMSATEELTSPILWDWEASEWSPEQIHGLSETLRTMESKMAELNGVIAKLHLAHRRPRLRFVCGTLFRFILSLPGRFKSTLFSNDAQ